MLKKIDMCFVTNIPAFYKIKLYNAINIRRNIFVVFLDSNSNERKDDFYNEQIQFPHANLGNKSAIDKLLYLVKLIISNSYSNLIVGGWDSLYYWLLAFISKKRYNAMVIESSYFESKINGWQGILKKIFLSRIAKVFVSGKNQKKILELLSYKGIIIKTFGVGLYNRVIPPVFSEKKAIKNFLYVGRLAPEKNLGFLIEVFNKNKHINLNIIGYGPLEAELRQKSNENIHFLGEIENKKLFNYYRMNDVFVLASISEPWGLVVEEALNNGLPAIVSNRVGCAEEIVIDGTNGFIFENTDISLQETIDKITNIDIYNRIRKNVCDYHYEEQEAMQISAYLKNT